VSNAAVVEAGASPAIHATGSSIPKATPAAFPFNLPARLMKTK
jgi:hypothetical protein